MYKTLRINIPYVFMPFIDYSSWRLNLFVFIILATLIFSSDSLAIQKNSSTIVVAEDIGIVGVIKRETKSLSLLSVDDFSVIQQFSLQDTPTSVAYDKSAEAFYVASFLNSSLLVISAKTFNRVASLKLERPPGAILTTKAYLIVSNLKFGTVSVYDKYNLTLLKVLDIGGEPRGISYLKERDMIYVADLMSGNITVVSLKDLTIAKRISTGETATLTDSVIFDLKNDVAYVPQTFKNNDNKTLQFDTTVFPSLSVIDLTTNSNVRKRRIGIDVVDEPIGIPLSGDIYGDHLYIVNYASNDLTVLSLDNLTLVAHLELGHTPFGLAFDSSNSRAIINNTLDGTISVIDSNTLVVIDTIKVADFDESSALLNGERLFNNSHDVRLAKDQWISCATCHFEGGNDKSSWFFPDGKRSTPTLFNVVNTAPFHWNGDLDEIQDVEFTIQDLMSGLGLSGGLANCNPNCTSDESNAGRSQDLDDLASYVKSLKFPGYITSQNKLVNRESYDRGRGIFQSETTDCVKCHKPPHYLDNKNHVTSLVGGDDFMGAINTPTLLGLRDSPPYLHDGSASNLRQVLERTKEISDHGKIDHLSDKEIDDLLIFLDNIEIPDVLSEAFIFVEEYNATSSAPKDQISMADIDLSVVLGEGTGNLKLSINLSSNSAVDVYLAILDLISNDFFMIDKNLRLGEANTPIIYKTSDGPISLIKESIYDLDFDPLALSGSRFQFYTIIVGRDKSVYQNENWITFDNQLIEF